jgi:hypothetical protein
MNLFLDILVGLLGQGIGLSQGLYLHRTTQHRKTHTSMPQVGFEPVISVFKWSEAIYASDCAAIVTSLMTGYSC